ncbi:MAG: DNA replication/repair protein RecF [Bacillota bacterium]
MRIERLELHDFRNYQAATIVLAPGLNAFIGPNAAGKTNILEAVYCLSAGGSYRTAGDRELVRWGTGAAAARALVHRGTGCLQVEFRLSGGRKHLLLNGKEQRRAADFAGRLVAVAFAPEDLDLLKGPPRTRRQYLDRALSQGSPAYAYHLSRYQAILDRRNRLLKLFAEGRKGAETLSVLDSQLAGEAAELSRRRAEGITALGPQAGRLHAELSGQAPLQVTYSPALPGRSDGRPGPLPAGPEGWLDIFSRSRQLDIARQSTTYGPHRDELSLTLEGADLRVYGSQGQQRTAALALKLAEIGHLTDVHGERPVLLLDDVLSELDQYRRGALFELVEAGTQTLLTATGWGDLPGGPASTRAARFAVASGRVAGPLPVGEA